MSDLLWELLGARRSRPGAWKVSIQRDWWAWSGPHGGVLGALATGAGSELSPSSAVRSIDLRYLERSDGESLSFTSVLRRTGRGLQVVEVTATQDSRTLLTCSITLAGAAETNGTTLQYPSAPAVPPPDDCARIPVPEQIVPIGAHLEIRPAGGALPLSGAASAEMCVWLRLDPPIPVDAAVSLIVVDALPPGIYPLLSAPVAIPTVQLSVHLHADLAAEPVEGCVLVIQRNVSTRAGWSIDDTDVWDTSGRLLVQARQLRRILGRLEFGSDPERESAAVDPK